MPRLFTLSAFGPLGRPGLKRLRTTTSFSRRTYRLVTLGISVAFGLVALPAGVLPRAHTSPGEALLLFINAVLLFLIQFRLHYVLRYCTGPVQRWLAGLSPLADGLARAGFTLLAVSAYCTARYYLDPYLGLRLDTTPLPLVLAMGQVIAVVGLSFQLGVELVERSRYLALENGTLKREQLQARYDSLKQQLSPHFLFNSLSTLSGLIQEEPNAAERFVDEMARVYRYLLKHGEQSAVPLRDELNFVRSYTYMLQMRFGEGISLCIDLPEAVLGRQLPPLALQLLVENAVKHNTVSYRQPLELHIDFVAPATLRVRNPRRPRLAPEASSGVGLSNLTNRIRLLNQQRLLVEQTADEFCVLIPLPPAP